MLIDNLGGPTSDLLHLTLDAVLKRQEIIANNVANVETQGYSAKSLDFGSILQNYFDASTGRLDEASFLQDLDDIKQQINSEDSISVSTDEQVKLDEQMVQLTENVLHYQALLEASSKRGAILKLAISGGRSD
jgi:flagellar basal-body rod protein FlgB